MLIVIFVGMSYLIIKCLNCIDPDDNAYYAELERTREDRIRRGACVAPFS